MSENKEHAQAEALASLSNLDGWTVLKERIQSTILKLSEMAEMVEPSESVETIGFKFLATRVAIAHLQGVINDVEATARNRDERARGVDTDES